MKKVLLKGFFEKNLGDDLFIKVIIERYPNIKFDMYSRYNYKRIIKRNNVNTYSRLSTFGILRILNKLLNLNSKYELENFKKYDKIIKIGGSLFIEPTNFETNRYREKIKNEILPNYIIGANFGPYNSKEFLDLYKNEIFPKIDDICFRDLYSYNLFDSKNIRVASDIVFGLDISNVKITNTKRVIISVINCYKDNLKIDKEMYYKKIEECIRFFKEREYKVLLMSFCKSQGDEEVINDIINRNANIEIEKYFYRGNIDEALNIIADSQVIMGGRFHANILGMKMNKTVIPVAYSNKTINILKDLNFKGKIFDIRNMGDFDIRTVTEQELNYKLDVTYQICDSQKHFKKLDEIFMRKE